LPSQGLSSSGDTRRRVTDALEAALRPLTRPQGVRRLRQVLLLLLSIWGVIALSQLIWTLLPVGNDPWPADAEVINPVALAAPTAGAEPVDLARVRAWQLFGEAGAQPAPGVVAQPAQSAATTALEGIEKGARETRLALKLRGVVASSEEGRGFAIIEIDSVQDIYSVDDKLPLPGQVRLAKVLPGKVVLDNGGTYELLALFEDSSLDTQLLSPPVQAQAAAGAAQAIEMPAGGSASAVARSYRERLYQNPQSLADVVSVSAVRENGQLLGYRIAPGKEQEQFALLGFQPGDLVTGVNGIALNDPANTLRLYQTMRSAGEAVFDLQRGGVAVTVSVSLGEEAAAQ
jgi:general secretion pathway protein C